MQILSLCDKYLFDYCGLSFFRVSSYVPVKIQHIVGKQHEPEQTVIPYYTECYHVVMNAQLDTRSSEVANSLQ